MYKYAEYSKFDSRYIAPDTANANVLSVNQVPITLIFNCCNNTLKMIFKATLAFYVCFALAKLTVASEEEAEQVIQA